MENITYKEKLKDCRWIEKREAFKSYKKIHDNLACSGCGTDDKLNVHHVKYIKGKEPWEYDYNDLDLLCESCHKQYHENKSKLVEILTNRRLIFSYDFEKIIKVCDLMCKIDTNSYSEILEFVEQLYKKEVRF